VSETPPPPKHGAKGRFTIVDPGGVPRVPPTPLLLVGERGHRLLAVKQSTELRGVRAELTERHPTAAQSTYHSKPAAIKMFCRECMGGAGNDHMECTEISCWLWSHAWLDRRLAAVEKNER